VAGHLLLSISYTMTVLWWTSYFERGGGGYNFMCV